MENEFEIEPESAEVLKALAIRKNVILAGPPGTGKSRLLNKVGALFAWHKGSTGTDPSGEIPIPPASSPIPEWFPSPGQTASRKSYPTVFDQNTKYRDFMRGLVPKIDKPGAFVVTKGTLYRASMHASQDGNASLVIIDEINRGAAVAAFGSALVGLDPDKRMLPNRAPTSTTQFFEILDDDGQAQSFALPNDVYVLAAMNEADTSVEPLDVAFLRRFHIHRLEPNVDTLRSHLGLTSDDTDISSSAAINHLQWYEALAQAFERVNDRLLLGRGRAFQLGHGALMHIAAPADSAGAEDYVATAWATMRAHLDEVFYGDTRAIAEVLQADQAGSPYTLLETTFAGQSVRRILGPDRPRGSSLFQLLKAVAVT